ncbi:MAG: beta strand repeat-containing protein, partial [Ferruginibacter sp.]
TGGSYNPLNNATATAHPALAPYWEDLQGSLANNAWYQTTGVAPNRVFTFEWKDWGVYTFAAPASFSMQVKVYELNGKIEYIYNKLSGTQSDLASIGITNTSAVFLGLNNTSTTPTASTATSIITTAGVPDNNQVYTFTPPTANASPSALNFTAVTGTSMTLNWTDNATNESYYAVQRSSDGGLNYTTLATLAANTITYNATNLLPGQTYTFKVISGTEGNMDSYVVASQVTNAPGAIVSTGVGGNWKNPLTWVGGIVPTVADSVIISDGATVVIDTTAGACYALVVGQGFSGILQYRATPAATLNVSHSVYINAGGSFTAGTGILTTHTLTVGVSATTPSPGNIVNNGTLDFSGTAGANITFFGNVNGSISGAGTYDFKRITLNKGSVSVNRPTLTINTPFTTEGASAVGMILTHTAGVLQIAGSFTQTCVLYNSTAGTIPLLGGIWLNNPNFTVTAQNGNMTNSGLLRISQGTYNISTLATAVLNFSAGSELWVEGGVLNHAARILTSSAITFTQSGGVINVATVGNSTSNSASFGITSTASTINWTGGKVVLNQRSTGTTIADYNVLSSIGTFNGTLQIGSAATATNFDFRINGNTPNIIIDSTTNNKSALLRLQTNILGKIYVPVGCKLNLNG